MEHEGVVGVVWYDFTELAKNTSAKGGRYAVNDAIDRVSYEGIDCESEAITYAEKDCYYAGNDKYLYFDINENVVDGVNENVTLSFDYYDNSTNDLVLTYTDGVLTDNDLADSEDASITIARTGTNKWIHKEIEIESGNFENINPYRTDFKVGGGDVYLANIDVSNIADSYAGGDGTKENPYQISNAAELRFFTEQVRETTDRIKVDSNISYTVKKASDSTVTATYTPERYHVFTDKHFELTNDIDLCNQPFMPVGNLIYNFNGHFNGNGYKISNAYIDGTSPEEFERYAFFGSTGANAEITNLGLENLTCKFKCSDTKYSVTINGEPYTYSDRLMGAAGFVASYAGGTFKNCYLKNAEVRDIAARMSSRGTGGFFGLGYGTVKATESNGYNALTVKNCYINGAVIRSHSTSFAFIGQDFKPNSSDPLTNSNEYRVTKTLTNCYTVNVRRGYYSDTLGNSNGSYEGDFYPFTPSGLPVANNCYTTSMGEKTVKSTDGTYITAELSDKKLAATDMATVNDGLVDNINYYKDVRGINDGYPVLVDMSESEVWNGEKDKKPEGDGTPENPYLISSKEELIWFRNSVNTVSDEGYENGYKSEADSCFRLVSDIDFEGQEWEPIGNTKVSFNGHFDGNGYIVKNFKISTKTSDFEKAYATADTTSKSTYYTDKRYQYVGFFGRTGNDSVIENLGVEDAEIVIYNADYYYQFETDENGVITENGKKSIRTQHPGGMVGNANGKFINCYIKNSKVKNMRRTISDSGVGGFAGQASSSASFVGCYVKNVELCSSYYNRICGFTALANKNTVFTDCYVADVVEERKYATNSDMETTAYGFARATSGTKVTNCFSTLADFAATTAGSGSYNSAYSYGTVSKDGDLVTKEEIINGVTQNGNLIADDNNINNGYPICPRENKPFKDYVFTSTKDDVTRQGFISGGMIDSVSFYKNGDASDCYMYTVLYDKTNNKRMIACSIDFIDNDLALKSTHTIKLSTPIVIPKNNTDKYMLKLIFVTGEKSFTPICDNFLYSE